MGTTRERGEAIAADLSLDENGFWHKADAAEWLRRKGFEGLVYRMEKEHHVFFEKYERQWGKPVGEERLVAGPKDGVSIVYRTYRTKEKPDSIHQERELAGGLRLVRCFKFAHGNLRRGGPVGRTDVRSRGMGGDWQEEQRRYRKDAS